MEEIAQHVALKRGQIAVAGRPTIAFVIVDRFFKLGAQ
jgi:hypothetical protein